MQPVKDPGDSSPPFSPELSLLTPTRAELPLACSTMSPPHLTQVLQIRWPSCPQMIPHQSRYQQVSGDMLASVSSLLRGQPRPPLFPPAGDSHLPTSTGKWTDGMGRGGGLGEQQEEVLPEPWSDRRNPEPGLCYYLRRLNIFRELGEGMPAFTTPSTFSPNCIWEPGNARIICQDKSGMFPTGLHPPFHRGKLGKGSYNLRAVCREASLGA